MNLIRPFNFYEILLFCCLALPVLISGYNPLFPDFPGPYCEKVKQCCDHRQDSCSIRISDTLCYCDSFCDRDHGTDCCPDYKSFCRGGVAEHFRCFYNNRYYNFKEKAQENCNTCKCGIKGQMECTSDMCITDEALIHNVNLIATRLGWEARNYSEFWGRKLQEGMDLRLGTLQPSNKVKSMSRISNRASGLPRHFNALEHWKLSDEIVDQGWCGTSWVMSTASVASDRFAIQSKGREMVRLAPQHILSCSRRSRGCAGGHLDVAWRFLNKRGVVDEDCYPYNPKKSGCQIRNIKALTKAGCSSPANVDREDFYRMGPAYSLNNETDIMSEIMDSGPVQATMQVYRDFFSYARGIYRHSAASRGEKPGFHSVRIVGWGEEHGYNPIKYWIAANSWGDWWGEDGFFRILRGSNECLIEDYVLASLPHVYDNIKNRRHHRP